MVAMRIIVALTVASSIVGTTPAWALAFLQGAAGTTAATVSDGGESSGLAGYSLMGALHFDPIPLLPVAFGGSMQWARLTGHDAVSEAVGYELALEAVGWYTFAVQGYNFSPYAKVGQLVLGSYRVKEGDGRGKYAPRGLRTAIGLRWDVLFRLGLLLEVEKVSRTLSGDEQSFDSDTVGVLLGWQTGI